MVRWDFAGSQALLRWDCGENTFSKEAFMGSSYFLHSAFGQIAASLPAGANSLQEVTEHTNKALNTFQVGRGISCTFNRAGSQKAGANRQGDKMPTPELLLTVFLVPYSNRVKILKPRRDYRNDLVSPSA